MKTFILAFLLLFSTALSASELSDSCLDCHEFAFDFEDVTSVAEMSQLLNEQLEVKKHKATLGMTPEQIQELSEYIMSEVKAGAE
jgi:hypothetical protein